MRKSTLVLGSVLVLTLVLCTSAYAGDGGNMNAWEGFWDSIGHFTYNAMPWNWGQWMGK